MDKKQRTMDKKQRINSSKSPRTKRKDHKNAIVQPLNKQLSQDGETKRKNKYPLDPFSERQRGLMRINIECNLGNLNRDLTARKISNQLLAKAAIVSKDTVIRFLENKNRPGIASMKSIVGALLKLEVWKSQDEVLDWLLNTGWLPKECAEIFAPEIKDVPKEQHPEKYKAQWMEDFIKEKAWWQRYPKAGKISDYTFRNVFDLGVGETLIAPTLGNASHWKRLVICYGIHGCGKTTTLQYLSQTTLQDWYRDGIFWIDSTVKKAEEAEVQLAFQWQQKPFMDSEQNGHLVSQWEQWISDPWRRALIVLDEVNKDILRGLLKMGGERIQFILLTAHYLSAKRETLKWLEEKQIDTLRFTPISIQEVDGWLERLKIEYSLTDQIWELLVNDKENIYELCDKISFLPEGIKFILHEKINKFSNCGVSITSESLGIPDLANGIVDDMSDAEFSALLNLEEFSKQYSESEWFDLSFAPDYFGSDYSEIEEWISYWVDLGILQKRQASDDNNGMVEYCLLRVINEACLMARRIGIDTRRYLKLDF